jgi:CRISPR-associated protein Csd1
LDAAGRLDSVALHRLNTPGAQEAIRLNTPYVYRSGQRPPATLLVDTVQYALGLPKDDTTKQRKAAAERHADYKELIERWAAAYPDDQVTQIVREFVVAGGLSRLDVPDDARPSDLFGIRVAGAWVHDRPSAREFWARVVRERKTGSGTGLCLVCGSVGALLDTLPESVKGGAIPAAEGRSRDAQVVSINKPAQGRAGAIQLVNTPICEVCGNRSVATLNSLLADDGHRRRWRDSVLVWWLRVPAPSQPMRNLLDEPPTAREVAVFFDQLNHLAQGRPVAGPDANHFYALTLSVNQSRVVVRDWIDVPLAEVEENVMCWFADQLIADGWREAARAFPLWQLALAAGRWDGNGSRYIPDSRPHGIERQLLMAALRRTPLPSWLLPHLLQRVRADAHIDAPRMALLRLLLTRNTNIPEGVRMPDLNPDEADSAYRAGRAFAVLEALQRRALGRQVNATVVDRLFRRAVTSPRSALIPARLTASGHLRRLRTSRDPKNRAAGSALDARLAEVWPAELPAVLDQAGQARFLTGYHQQRAADLQAARAAKARGAQDPTVIDDADTDTDDTQTDDVQTEGDQQ